MTIGVAQWRARRLPGTGVPRASGEAVPQSDPVGVSAQQQRRSARAERVGAAAATKDRFLDVVVLLSVAVFVALALGTGALVLQSALHR